MEDYIKCELIGRGFTRYPLLQICLLLLYTTHISIHALLLLTAPMYTTFHYKISDHTNLVAIVQSTSCRVSFSL